MPQTLCLPKARYRQEAPEGAEHGATAANADAPMTEMAEAPAQAAN